MKKSGSKQFDVEQQVLAKLQSTVDAAPMPVTTAPLPIPRAASRPVSVLDLAARELPQSEEDSHTEDSDSGSGSEWKSDGPVTGRKRQEKMNVVISVDLLPLPLIRSDCPCGRCVHIE